jgi:uncharacterized protein (DUF342 family)
LRTFGAILLVVAAIALPSIGGAQQTKLYKWTDANGQVHYSETVPPEYANRDREVLNNQGVRVGAEEGEITEEERAIQAQRDAQAEADRQAKEEIARRDRMLLETYISVADIEDLRNRRLELLESQIKLTEVYLGNLRKRLLDLEAEASNYKPYSTREDAPQIPDNLKLDMSRTTASIAQYEQTLSRTRANQKELQASFDDDIARFRQIKGVGY